MRAAKIQIPFTILAATPPEVPCEARLCRSPPSLFGAEFQLKSRIWLMSVAGESKMKVHELSDLLLRFAKPLDGKRLALLEEETSGLGRTRVRNELHVLGRENPLDCGGLDKGGVKCFSRVCKLLQSNGRRLRPCVWRLQSETEAENQNQRSKDDDGEQSGHGRMILATRVDARA